MIEYKEDKHIDGQQLFALFQAVEWIKPTSHKLPVQEPEDAIANDTFYIDDGKYKFLTSAFINSNYVVSAWDDRRLVGVVRVLSDTIQRSVVYDLAVFPDYQEKGIGSVLISKCLQKFKKTQITLGTSSRNFKFYEKLGFRQSRNYLEKVIEFY
jgi:ribosomal protein S18 acetylase RimI-like enzyme